MSTYLVTGGAGFIGTNITKFLLDQGHAVRVFDNYAAGKKPERLQSAAQYVEGDIRQLDQLVDACQGVEGIFHLAALPRVPFSVEHPLETHQTNVDGTLNVLLAARETGVKRVVFSSSSSAYGDQTVFPLREDMPALPISPYALHKFIGEHYCRLFASLYGLETVALRYFNVYGPFFDPNGAYALVIGRFLRQRAQGEPMTVCGDGKYYRDFTHVTDIARANYLAMTKPTVGKGEVINIGNGEPHSVMEIVEMIGGPHEFVQERPGDIRMTHADNSKAKALLGWEPTVSFDDGVAALKRDFKLKSSKNNP